MKINFYNTLILVFLLFQDVSAQKNWYNRKASVSDWEIGLSGGISTFVTTINPGPGAPNSQINYWNREVNPGVGLSVLRNISPSIGVEMDWLNTQLTGSWNESNPPLSGSAGHKSPLPFKSQINQIDLMVAFNVNQMMLPGDEEDLWHIFLKPGIGITNIVNYDKWGVGSNYTNTRMSFALDAGVSVSLNEKIKLIIGNTIRSVNTDNLDGTFVVSTGINGETINYMKVFELYNYSYLRVSYCLDNFGSKKSKSTIKKRNGKFRIYRRR